MASEKRLIEANALIKKAEMRGHCIRPLVTAFHMCVSVHDIDEAPTVDAVEVVHGRWEKVSEKMPIYRCSICKERNLFKNGYNVFSNYCPNCGAKMDGGNEDGNL